MADSKDNYKDSSFENKADNLDEMLNQAENQIDEKDEFSDDDTVEQLLVEDDFDENDLIDSLDTKSEPEADEFADKRIEPESETDSDDLIMEDFDISAAEDELSRVEREYEEQKENEVSSAIEDLDGQITQADELLEKVASEAGQEEQDIEHSSVSLNAEEEKKGNEGAEIAGMQTQISQIWAENEDLKEQIEILSTKTTDITNQDFLKAEQLENLQKEQRKLVKSIKHNNDKPPKLTYIALGVAVFSLLTGSILGFMGLGARSDVAELTELVGSLEEEIVILNANSSKEGIQQVNEQIKLLIAKDDLLNIKLNEINHESQAVFLKPVIDDLVEQNEGSKQAIDQLIAKVDKLEQEKSSRVKRSKSNKTTTKKGWIVNLVSFRQKWYANNKLVEFKKKNVAAEIIQVKVKGETWYRLRVKGFRNRNEASAYSEKVKKTLNLSSVWVTKG